MNTEVFDLYEMSDEKESRLWEDCIFIFDSSALLYLYYIPKEARDTIYSDVFEKLTNRLWIPFHVQYEYLKNRQKVIKKPISENYKPLEEKIKKLSNIVNNDLLGKATEIKNYTKNNNKHPYLEQEEIDKFIEKIHEFTKYSNIFNEEILKKVSEKTKEISDVDKNDDILELLTKYFSIGEESSFEEILKITKEGKHRYEFDIPPGYGDSRGKTKKKGTQIFGDLIIWKQILKYSKINNKAVIFITNDITKDEDWCYSNKSNIVSPREELIKEIKDHSGVEFWMYSLSQYLYKAKKYLHSEIQEDVIENISDHIINDNNHQLAKKILEIVSMFNDIYIIDNLNGEFFINKLIKYFNMVEPDLIISKEFNSKNKNLNTYMVDFIVEKNGAVIPVEVMLGNNFSLVSKKTNNLLLYLSLSDIKEGVIYAPYVKNPYNFKFGSVSKIRDSKSYHVSQIFAK